MKRLTLSSLCEFWDHITTLCLRPGFMWLVKVFRTLRHIVLWSSVTHMTVIAHENEMKLMKWITLSSLCEFWDRTTTFCLRPGFLGFVEDFRTLQNCLL